MSLINQMLKAINKQPTANKTLSLADDVTGRKVTLETQIAERKATIKKLVKQYLDTPSTLEDADMLLGIIAVHKEELKGIRKLDKRYKAQQKAKKIKQSSTNRITSI